MIRVVCTSDFHWLPPPEDVPAGDLLVLAGDVLDGDLDRFGDWLGRQPHAQIVGVAGNHDRVAKDLQARVRGLPWTYLENEAATVADIRVFGSPLSTPFNNWDFMAPEDELAEAWALIPDDTELLVVHGPAKGILDKTTRGVSTGSVTLRERIAQLPRLRLLVTGHIHEAYGLTAVPVGDTDEMRWLPCVNASYVDASYRPGNPPVLVEL